MTSRAMGCQEAFPELYEAVDRVRSVSSETAPDKRYAFTSQERESDPAWDSLARKHHVQRVRGAVSALTPIQRRGVQLAYYDGLTESQIFATLQLPLGTVKTRIRDGRRRLGPALGGGEP